MAMANDVEYVQSQIDRAGNTADLTGSGPRNPPLTEWSMLAEKMAENTEEVRALKVAFVAANSKKGAKKPEWRPVLRPIGVMAELLKKKRYENHYALRARLMPGKYGTPEQKAAARARAATKTKETTVDKRANFVRRP